MKQNLQFIFTTGLFIIVLLIYGYVKAIPPANNSDEANPKIELSPQSFNFGEVEFGKVAEYTFRIKNSGQAVLEIKKVATSCACTTAKVTKNVLFKGEEAELLVRYDTAAMGNSSHGKGKQERIIYVKSNDPVNPQSEAIIYAYVLSR